MAEFIKGFCCLLVVWENEAAGMVVKVHVVQLPYLQDIVLPDDLQDLYQHLGFLL